MNRTQVLKRVREVHDHCPHCGNTETLQIHHRKNRGMGGRGKNSLDRFDNFLRVCAWLNYAMESNVDVAAEAREMGWKLGQWDGFESPYFDKTDMRWYLLTQDGRKIHTHPPMYLI
jgi:hypothetical protein